MRLPSVGDGVIVGKGVAGAQYGFRLTEGVVEKASWEGWHRDVCGRMSQAVAVAGAGRYGVMLRRARSTYSSFSPTGAT